MSTIKSFPSLVLSSVNATTTLEPGVYDLDSSGGSFTLSLSNEVGIWRFTNTNKSLDTNAVTISSSGGITFTDPTGAQVNADFIANVGGKQLEFLHIDGGIHYRLNVDNVSSAKTFTPRGSWNATTNVPDLTVALNKVNGSEYYVYYIDTAGTQDLGSGSVNFEVGGRIEWYSTTVYKYIPPTSVSVDSIQVLNVSGNVLAWNSVVLIGDSGNLALSPTITLPSAAGNIGKKIKFVRVDAGPALVFVVAQVGETIYRSTVEDELYTQNGTFTLEAVTATRIHQVASVSVMGGASTANNTIRGGSVPSTIAADKYNATLRGDAEWTDAERRYLRDEGDYPVNNSAFPTFVGDIETYSTYRVQQATPGINLVLRNPVIPPLKPNSAFNVRIMNGGIVPFSVLGVPIAVDGFADFVYNAFGWRKPSVGSAMTGATNAASGISGDAPQPILGQQNQFLKGDATYGSSIPLHVAAVNYTIGDVVYESTTKNLYRAIVTHTSVVAHPSLALANWERLASSSTSVTSLSLANFAASGPIGTAAATVDSFSHFAINQTNVGISLTVPVPTSPTTGQMIEVTNVGSTGFIIENVACNMGRTIRLTYSGFGWSVITAGNELISPTNSGRKVSVERAGTDSAFRIAAPLVHSVISQPDTVTGGVIPVSLHSTGTFITLNQTAPNANALLTLDLSLAGIAALGSQEITLLNRGEDVFVNGVFIPASTFIKFVCVPTLGGWLAQASPPAALTTGKVGFGVAGALGSEAEFSYDSVNKRLGVGTATPLSAIHVQGDGSTSPNNAAVRSTDTGAGGRSFMVSSRSDGAFGARYAFSDETAGAVRGVIGSNGYWGFGTEGPGSKLHLAGDGTADFRNTSIRYVNSGAGGRTWNAGTRGNRYFISDETAGAERFSIIDNGEVYMNWNAGQQLIAGIGNATLNIQANGGNYALNLRGNGGDSVVNIQTPTAGDSTFMSFKTDDGSAGNHAGSIQYRTSDNLVLFLNTSDERLKTDTGRKAKGLEDLMQLRVRNYNWKQNGRNSDGFFAQELAQVVPVAVTPGTDELNEHGYPKLPWQVDYGKLTTILVQAVQDLNAKVEELTAKLEAKG